MNKRESKVMKAIQILKNGRAAGVDGIMAQMLKNGGMTD